jgi:hypothetical protein
MTPSEDGKGQSSGASVAPPPGSIAARDRAGSRKYSVVVCVAHHIDSLCAFLSPYTP